MKLVERYVFRRMVSALVLTFVALGTMVWLSQALRQFSLVTSNGESVLTFLHASVFLLPALTIIVLPIAALIAVIYVLTVLNGDSELVVINASGASQFSTLKPVLVVGLITAFSVGLMTLYFAPLSLRVGQLFITAVRGNILSSIVQEGRFMTLADGLTFHIRGRNPDGSLNGLFVVDDRESDKSITYLADRGAILDNPLGVFLVMTDGVIQQRNKLNDSISMIEFSSYAFDLSSFSGRGQVATLHPRERPTAYLLNPDPDDPYFRASPGEFRKELHQRLSTPLYGLAFAVLPLLFLGQAGSPREGRTANIVMIVLSVVAMSAVGIFLPNLAEASALAVVLMYALPAGVAVMSMSLALVGVQVRPPKAIVAVFETLYGWVSGLVRPRRDAIAGGPG